MGDYQDGDRIYATHWLSMKRAIAGDVIVSGIAVTETTPASMNVDVSAGHFYQNGTRQVIAGTTIAVNPSDTTNARLDLISGGPAGLVYTVGTPALLFAPPDLPAGHIAIAMIYVPANSTTVVQANIREFAFPSPFREHATQHEGGGADEVTPLIHGQSHEYGYPDELKVEDLATTEFATDKFLQPGGAGNLVWNEQQIIEVAVKRVYDGASKTRINKVTKLFPYSFDGGTVENFIDAALQSVDGVEFSPNGQFVTCGNKIYSLSGRTIKTFHVSIYGSSENTFKFSPCGLYVASKYNNNIMLYTIKSDGLTLEHQLDTGSVVLDIAWTPDSRWLSVTRDAQIDNYDIQNKLFVLQHTYSIGTGLDNLDYTPDGDMIACSRGNLFTVRKIYHQISAPTTWSVDETFAINDISWHPTGDYVLIATASSSSGSVLRRRNRVSGAIEPTPITHSIHAGQIKSISWSPNGKFLAVCLSVNDNIRVYRYTAPGTFTLISDISLPAGSGIVGKRSLAWSADQQYVAAGFIGTGGRSLILIQTTAEMPAEGILKTIGFRRGVDE